MPRNFHDKLHAFFTRRFAAANAQFSGVDKRVVYKRVVSKRVVLADVPPERKLERGYIRMFPWNEDRNEGMFACSPELKPERGHVRQNHPFTKPPFYLVKLHGVFHAADVKRFVRDRKVPQRTFVTKISPNVRVNFLARFASKPLFCWVVPSNCSDNSLVLFVRFCGFGVLFSLLQTSGLDLRLLSLRSTPSGTQKLCFQGPCSS